MATRRGVVIGLVVVTAAVAAWVYARSPSGPAATTGTSAGPRAGHQPGSATPGGVVAPTRSRPLGGSAAGGASPLVAGGDGTGLAGDPGGAGDASGGAPGVGAAAVPFVPGVGTPRPGRVDPPAETTTYVLDNGAVVRDHRGAGAAPPVGPPPMAPSTRTMNSQLTAQIYIQLAPMVKTCGADIPAAERGADPYVHVTLTVDVAGGQLTTSDVYPVAHDLTGPGSDAFVACLRTAARAIVVPAAGEPEVHAYRVQYPIRVR